MTSHTCWRVLAWSALMAGSLLLTALLQALATAGSEGASQAERGPMDLSAAIATRTNCETIVGQPLYVGQNTWVGANTLAVRECGP
jgi:hypothetical protein